MNDNKIAGGKANVKIGKFPFSSTLAVSLIIVLLFSFLWVSPSQINNFFLNSFPQSAYAQSTGIGGSSRGGGTFSIPEYAQQQEEQQLPSEEQTRRIHGQVVDGVTDEPIANWNAKLYLIDDSGYRTWIKDLSNISEIIDVDLSMSEQVEKYQIDIFSVNSSSGTEQFGQALFTVVPDAPEIVDINTIRMYSQTVFVGGANGVSTSPSEAATGSSVTVRIQYNNTSNREIDRANLLLEVPNNTELVQRSITLNGKGVNASSVEPPYYQLSLNDDDNNDTNDGVATYKIRLSNDFNASDLDISAKIRYTVISNELNATNDGQSKEEVIGTAHVVVPQVSIAAPAEVTALNITLSGVGPVGRTVHVYDGNITLGDAQVSKGGLWQLATTLPDQGSPSTHSIRAEVNTDHGIIKSNEAVVVFDPNKSTLTKVCMQQSGGQGICFDPAKGVARSSYRLNTNPISFELYFNKPEAVSNVAVALGGPGGGSAMAILANDGVYRAAITPNLSENLGQISVFYNNWPPLKLIDGKLPPPPPKEELLRTMPPELTSMNITVLGSNATGQNASGTLTDGRHFDISTNINPNVRYLPDAEDLEKVKSSGLPFYGLELNQKEIDGVLQLELSYFVPYSALPPEVLEAIESTAPTEISQDSSTTSYLEKIVPISQESNPEAAPTEISQDSSTTSDSQGLSGIRATTDIRLESDRISLTAQDYQDVLEAIESTAPTEISQDSSATTVTRLEGGHRTLTAQDVEDIQTISRLALTGATGMLSLASLYWGAPAIMAVGLSAFGAGFLLGIAIGAGLCLALCHKLPAVISWLIDPSGYVYEAVHSNRLENVTATVTVKDEDNGTWSSWNAQEFGQTNPQMTDSEGRYGWDVPEGEWQVAYQKPGYQNTQSEVIHVPPPRTDVNIGIVSLEPPEVTAVSAIAGTDDSDTISSNETSVNNTNDTANSINIQFDKYVFADNLTTSTIAVFDSDENVAEEVGTLDNNHIAGSVIAVNPVDSPEGIPLTRQASFVPLQEYLIANETYDLHVSKEIQSYAGIPMPNDYHEVVTVMPEPNYSLAINSSVTLATGASTTNQTIDNEPLLPAATTMTTTTIPLGSSLNAITNTNDQMSSKTTFTFYDPDNLEIAMETINASSEGLAYSSEFTPTETGMWRVQALFTDGNNIFESRSVSFNVTERGAEEEEEEVLVTPEPTISNTPPIADAGADQQVQEDTMIVLNGTNSSDPDSIVADDNKNLTFSWSQKEEEEDDNTGNTTTTRVDLVGENTATPIFIAPSINSDDLAAAPMTLTFELRVTDEHNSSSVDTVNITVHDSPKTEVKAVKKIDPIDINTASSANDDDNNNNSSTINATTVTLEVTGFGSTSTEESIVPMDIVFAIDSSNSMEDSDPDNLRLEAAKSFLDKLNQTRDRAGVVNWDGEVEDTFGLTSDYESLKTNIDQTTLGSGTNLDEGLRGAIEVLDSSNNSTEVIGSSNSNTNDSSSSSKAIVFLTDGEGEYTPSSAAPVSSPSDLTESTIPIVDVAKAKGYRIFSIGLNIEPESDAEANLIDMASATGGQYFSSPTAENLDEVFNAIHQTVVRVSNTAPENVDVIEVTEDYIELETNFSIEPTSINQTGEGRTMITWSNVSQHVGNRDDKLTADETFVVTFSAGSSKPGNALHVNSAGESVVNYVDVLGNQKRVQISQGYINVNSTEASSNTTGGTTVPASSSSSSITANVSLGIDPLSVSLLLPSTTPQWTDIPTRPTFVTLPKPFWVKT